MGSKIKIHVNDRSVDTQLGTKIYICTNVNDCSNTKQL